MITLEGNKGVFMRRNVGDAGYEKPEAIGQTFSGVIVGVRQSLSDYKPRAIKSTPEYTSAADKVPLFEKKGKDAKAEKIDEASSVGLKARHPELREQRWLYLLVNGEVVKFRIKGAGLKHWFKFIKELTNKKLHTFDVRVKFDPLFETNEEIGKDYYTPALSIEKVLDDDEIEKTKRARLLVIAPYIKNGVVLFPRTGCEELLAQLFGFGVESHDDLVDALVYLILGLVEQGLELPKIQWIEA